MLTNNFKLRSHSSCCFLCDSRFGFRTGELSSAGTSAPCWPAKTPRSSNPTQEMWRRWSSQSYRVLRHARTTTCLGAALPPTGRVTWDHLITWHKHYNNTHLFTHCAASVLTSGGDCWSAAQRWKNLKYLKETPKSKNCGVSSGISTVKAKCSSKREGLSENRKKERTVWKKRQKGRVWECTFDNFKAVTVLTRVCVQRMIQKNLWFVWSFFRWSFFYGLCLFI